MAKSAAFKGCIFVAVVVLLAGGGILAWQLLADEDSQETGLFGTGIFGNNNETTVTETPSPTIAPTAAPTTPVYYDFDQWCSPNATRCCNGLENLCEWPVNEMLFGGVHNAMATTDKFLAPNQLLPVSQALEAGFRAINLDICNCQGKFQLCHGFCGLGEADPIATLTDIAIFLRDHPNEVIILVLEINSKAGQTVDLNLFYENVWTQIEGLNELLYVHEKAEDSWPTLGTLIDNQQRLIAFHLNGPDCTTQAGECPDGLHSYFQYAQETNFDFPSIESIEDWENSCPITRGVAENAFYAINNFVTHNALVGLDQKKEDAATTNAFDFVYRRIITCSGSLQKDASLLFVDFWSIGDVVQVVQEYNRDLEDYWMR